MRIRWSVAAREIHFDSWLSIFYYPVRLISKMFTVDRPNNYIVDNMLFHVIQHSISNSVHIIVCAD